MRRRTQPEKSRVELIQKALEDWGLNYPYEYVDVRYRFFKQFHVLPSAGGFDDQDPLLMEDFTTLSLHEEWIDIPEQPKATLGNTW